MATDAESAISAAWFPHQEDLPPLPVPALADTMERYLSSVRPLLSDDEYAHTKELVADFMREGGTGEGLQAMIEERAGTERNWMEEWWEQLAYLRTRTTMAIHINWFGALPEWGVALTNVQSCALLLDGILRMRQTLPSGAFPLETLRGNPLDMHQFSRVFGMTRVPAEGADLLVQVPDSRHAVLLRDGAVVTVPLYVADGSPMGVPQLLAQLEAALALVEPGVLEDQAVEASAERANVSVLTALNRDRWASERATLLADPTSAASLAAVEGAMFALSFDRAAPATKEAAARLAHGGRGRDKWFDKSVNAVVFENGRVGLNAEHTPIDAMTIVSMFVRVIGSVRDDLKTPAKRAALLGPPSAPRGLPPPKLLPWIIGPSTAEAIELGSTEILALASDCELRHLEYLPYGKGSIKRAKMHPDFYLQMAIQLAHYRLHGHVTATYETGHTRAFYHGRTDTVRTLTEDSAAFCKAMADAELPDAEKRAALDAACKTHGEQLQRVLTGQGIDRHLLGLMIASHLSGAESTPALFSDRAYKLSGGGGNFPLSTSNVGYTPMFGGFAPMTPDGYGVCYALLEGRINIAVTAWRSSSRTRLDAFKDALSTALDDLREVCCGTATSKL